MSGPAPSTSPTSSLSTSVGAAEVVRDRMEVDVVCVGFGPAAGGFAFTLSRLLAAQAAAGPALESAVAPGMPPQILCYERADDAGFGVSGVVTLGRSIRESFPGFEPNNVPLCAPVSSERVAYLLDPHGASARDPVLRLGDAMLRLLGRPLPWYGRDAFEMPWIPPFLGKHGGLVMSIGQFMQWVGAQTMGLGFAQVWPGTPVAAPLFEGERVVGVRLVDQGVDREGRPAEGFMPGMDVRAALTVVADGPVGAVGFALDERFGLPAGNHRRDWAVGMKAVVDLGPESGLAPGAVLHTFGYPEPEIFGFLYVYPENVASLGIFVPSWLRSPVRTSYRYLQHWMRHPYLARHLRGASLRSWGAKTLQEAGLRGEPRLCGDGFARIGEGSGTTNVLKGSGVDEAWATGVTLAEGVFELLKAKAPFTRENLERAYVARRRASWVEGEARAAARARDGFHAGVVPGMMGMGLAGMTGGRLFLPVEPLAAQGRTPSVADFLAARGVPPDEAAEEAARLRAESDAKGVGVADAALDRLGWPAIERDGRLFVSHQDALLMGGKVQAPAGYADHVRFPFPDVCRACDARTCIEICSGQAITPGPDGLPAFDREKCIHCGACLWACSRPRPGDPEATCVDFLAGAGGLHSAEN